MPRSESSNVHGSITVETEIMVIDVLPSGKVWMRATGGETFCVEPGDTFSVSVPVRPDAAHLT